MKKIIPDALRNSKRYALKDCQGAYKTYGNLFEEAECWKGILKKRSVICILCDKSLETVSFMIEMFLIGMVPMLLSPDMDNTFLSELMERYKISYIWCMRSRAGKGDVIKAVGSYVACCYGDKDYEIHPDLALLLSTSGSTGSPKMVRLSYDNLLYNITTSVERYNVFSEHRTITALPLYHIWGLQFCMWHWYAGAEVLVTSDSVMTWKFADFYTRERINNFAGVPYTYQMMHKLGFWNRERLDMLHMAMCAGAMLPQDRQDDMAHLMGERFWSQYGQTESTGAVLGCNLGNPNYKAGIIGVPLSGTNASIDKGEIMLIGRSVCMGYAYGYEDLAKGDETQGILYTGDMGMADQEGYFYITGRKSRFVKILGDRMSLNEIEKLLTCQDERFEIACIGDTDCVDIFYTGEEGIIPDERKWRHLMNDVLQIPAYMVHIHKIGLIPKNESGKILYQKLKRD